MAGTILRRPRLGGGNGLVIASFQVFRDPWSRGHVAEWHVGVGLPLLGMAMASRGGDVDMECCPCGWAPADCLLKV